MNDDIKMNIIQDKDYICKSKIIPCQKRGTSLEKKSIKIKMRKESSQIGNSNIYYNNYNFIYNNNSAINNNSKKNTIYNAKLYNDKNIYNHSNFQSGKKNDIKIIKENESTDINKIFQNKEKARTFNRQSSHKKVRNSPDHYKNKTNLVLIETKNRLEQNKGEIYKKKLINENIFTNNDNNNKVENIKNKNIKNIIYNTCNILEEIPNTKRNTDSIIHQSNQDIIYNESLNKTKERPNKVKSKITNKEYNNISNNNFNYSHPENKAKKKIIYPIPMNINIQNNNLEGIHKKRKNIDINTEYQRNPVEEKFFPLEKHQNINNLNNTIKVKLKANNIINNTEINKENDAFQFSENNSIIKSKSKVKMKLDNKKDPEIEIRIIEPKKNEHSFYINNNRISTNNDKNKINEINYKEMMEENPKGRSYNKIGVSKNINIKINNNINNKGTKVKIIQNNNNDQINRNSTYNNNENSFFTININNSNIDENNINEPKNNLGNYCFVNNAHINESINNFNINNQINNNISNNRVNNINVFKSNSKTNKNIKLSSINAFNENKNIYITSNNNFSNCNTGNTSNNIYNQNYINKDIFQKEKENIEKDKNNIDFETKINNEEKNKDEELILIELEEEKGSNDNEFNSKNLENKKEVLQHKFFNNRKITEELKEKDLSLDKSASLRVFSIPQEDFLEKDDDVLKFLNSPSPRDNSPIKNNEINSNININMNNNAISNIHQCNEEDESEIIIQNSEFSMMNDPSKYNYIINKNIGQSSNIYGSNNNNLNNNNNSNINIDNYTMKDTSIISNVGIKGCKSITQAGKERTGHRKKNQDNYIIEKNLNNILGFNLFAILDGHGDNGHLVSQLASKYIIKKFTKITNSFNDTEKIYNYFKKNDFQKIIDIFLEIDKEIIDQKKFDISLSGTTCVLVIQLNDHLICSNIGDSRAILIYDENKIFELSHDSKPNIPEEEKRINLMGGVVDQVEDEDGEKTGPYRVYIRDKDQPGLAMSRSFGDKKAKSCGVIPYPDIIEYNLNNDSKYMVLCSDGVWEFISNEEVMEIGNKYYNQNNMTDFCNELLKKSTEIWENEENYMDDITIVTVFF